MTHNTTERRRAAKQSSRARRKLPLYYKPLILKIIRFLERSEPILVMEAVPLDAQSGSVDESAVATEDQV